MLLDDISAVYGINDSETSNACGCAVVACGAKDWKVIHGDMSKLKCIYYYENGLSVFHPSALASSRNCLAST